MTKRETTDWGRRVLKGYITLVAGSFFVSFLIWAVWAVNGWHSPLNPDRNYEALFAVMFGVFVFFPCMLYVYKLFPELTKYWYGTRVTGLLLCAVGLACYIAFRAVVMLMQIAVLRFF